MPGEPNNWGAFNHCLNNWGKLKWTNTGFVDSLVFLDMTITILPDRSIHHKTYQKPLNLHLHIPPASAHPPGQLRSLVFGRLKAYWEQNTDESDFINISIEFGCRLIERGYSLKTFKPLFEECIERLNGSPGLRPTPTTTEKEPPRRPLCFHLPFHPRGVQRTAIRKHYAGTLAPHLPERRLIVAISRDKNLRDRLCSTILESVEGNNPSDHLTILRSNTH